MEDAVGAGRHADPDPGTGTGVMGRRKVVVQVLDERQTGRGAGGPQLIAGEPVRQPVRPEASPPLLALGTAVCPGDELTRTGLTERRISIRDHDRALSASPQHRDGWVGRDLAFEGVNLMHGPHVLDRVPVADDRAEGRAVLVPHPPVSADESKPSIGLERVEGAFKEPYVHVSPAYHRRPAPPVFQAGVLGNVLQPDVRRIAGDHVGLDVGTAIQQVVTHQNPSGHEMRGNSRRAPLRDQHVLDRCPALSSARGLQVKGAYTAVELLERDVQTGAGVQQPLHGRYHERTGPGCRLNEGHVRQVGGRIIADEIEQGIDDPAAGKDLAVRHFLLDCNVRPGHRTTIGAHRARPHADAPTGDRAVVAAAAGKSDCVPRLRGFFRDVRAAAVRAQVNAETMTLRSPCSAIMPPPARMRRSAQRRSGRQRTSGAASPLLARGSATVPPPARTRM